MLAADGVEKLHAGHLRHALVGHDDMDLLAAEKFHGFLGAGGAEDLVVEAQKVLNTFNYIWLVIHDENRVGFCHAWSAICTDYYALASPLRLWLL